MSIPVSPYDETFTDIIRWAQELTLHLQNVLGAPEVHSQTFEILHNEPERVFEGLMVLADGTDWDPGSGIGLYLYIGGAWTKL